MKTKCLTEGCDRDANARGLCCVCGLAAYKMVKRGQCTWEQLESLGLALPPISKVPRNLFRRRFLERTAEQEE
jgi:hypothetical protein